MKKTKLIQPVIALVACIFGLGISFVAINGDLVGYSVDQEMAIFLMGVVISIVSIVGFAKTSMAYFVEK
jgi:hypothetical protein